MSELRICPRCSTPLPDGAADGAFCLACSTDGGATVIMPAPTAAVLATIGDYEVIDKLGEGGMGTVYRARQVALGRIVALKVLPEQAQQDEDSVSRFEREAKVAARLNHPNLVRVYASGTADGTHFIAMELVEGENLHQRLKRGALPIPEALRVCADVARALQCGWDSAQLIHRDIKPSNIYLAQDGTAKLGDLGIAKSLLGNTTGITQTGMMMGTPHYISPEQAKADKNLDFRADIYSLGCTLFHCLTGRTPYSADDALTLMNQHLTAPPPALLKALPGAPMILARLVGKMLKKTKHERHASYADLIAEMDYVREQIESGATNAGPSALVQAWKQVGDAPSPARPATPRTAPASTAPAGKSKLPLYAAIAAAVLVLGVGAWWAMRPEKPRPTAAAPAKPIPATPAPQPTAQPKAPAADALKLVATSTLPAATSEPWQDVLRDPALLSLSSGAERTSNGLRLSPASSATVSRGIAGSRDGAIRARYVHSGGFVLAVRENDDGLYSLQPRPAALAIVRFDRSDKNVQQSSLLREFPLANPWQPGKTYEFELRVVGTTLTAKLDGKVLGTVNDETFREGRFSARSVHGEAAPTLVTSLEVLNLDGLPAAGASKPASVASAPLPASSSSAATATKDAPFINSLGMKFVPVPITGGPTDGKRVLFSVWETRVRDYEVFATETGLKWTKDQLKPNDPNIPAGYVSLDDARAFAAWLNQREQAAGRISAGEEYRLPLDHEWSCAIGIGEREDGNEAQWRKNNKLAGVFPWGEAPVPPPGAGNFSGEEASGNQTNSSQPILAGYRDDFPYAAPAGSFPANRWGIFDLAGNVAEWCEGNFDDQGPRGICRGGSFSVGTVEFLLSSSRAPNLPTQRFSTIGFRVVLAPAEKPAKSASATPITPATATKDAPFENSLGMKFVAVPITGGPTGGKRVLFSVWETRVQDYEPFITASSRPWPSPGFTQGPTHPAVDVTWEAAQAFCGWLSEREAREGRLPQGWRYRLPSDHEWSCSAGFGDQEDAALSPSEKSTKIERFYVWGTAWPPPTGAGNFAGEEMEPAITARTFKGLEGFITGYRDPFPTTAPVGSFASNSFGLHDLGGNAMEWCEDWFSADQKERVARDASWQAKGKGAMNASARSRYAPTYLSNSNGFRVVLAPADGK